ncbi:acylphosphatase [Marinoscillum sp. MHG1-6]|uniref:acylphosphatase n=1 Tax=Marinoscillum sp. MHG1-6 TaxID=2959627 RepID=UPI002157D29B|nr:acylphosphatase [Marinoscillum sp. MHG1-6]
MRSVSLKCIGRVQGVFYRASTKAKADELGLTGWVRNEPDGSVQIRAEGSVDAIESLITWCKKGPEFAAVRSVEVKEVEWEDFESFEIRRF